ncbi:MAG TPA: hypothetical protein P5186_05145 [Candidatus Paceibacterota bacterium]|nr:hypothetical protein [Verrucomicrobiota bacterium]HRY47414.1 hypothetical protein [Candidatus Paceibacterota bacterium]HSA00473.1 hypothetical protein [Candidatus Paceibacterota bacterium]
MKAFIRTISMAAWMTGVSLMAAQTGPFDPEAWPPTIDVNKTVHFVVTDGTLTSPGGSWMEGLQILTGGDQGTSDLTINGHTGKKVTGSYLNIADPEYAAWAEVETIDILMQVYGDAALFNAEGQPRNFEFLTGTLPELNSPSGGQIPVEARNKKWNWVLFRIPNGIRPSDGTRYVGSIPANAQGGTTYAGVNGGTIRCQAVPNLIVRAVAFGEEGAFGTPEDINLFQPAESCDPEPETNLAGIDLAAGVTNHVQILNDGDQTVVFANNIGPAGDKRSAVSPVQTFLNFGLTDFYLGKPCNDPRAVKVCLDFYDDPAFAGLNVRFGPEAYATDDKGGVAFFTPENRQTLTGSGEWIRRSWTVPAVNLMGVNAGQLTAGPRFTCENAPVFVSRYYIAVLRIGDHPLAGQDPLKDCVEDPNICRDVYGNYAELDLAKDVRNGLDVGSSGGDQEMIQEEAGPAGDRRMAIRPAREDGSAGFAHQYLNFAITDEALGPSSQPPAHLAICVTYYDDPDLAGKQFKPEVYMTERNGTLTFGFTPDTFFVVLEGTGQWREAYWEITDVKFNGVNQGPQAAARFFLNDKIFFSRVRYGVIPPCGPNADKNPLEECKPITDISLTATISNQQLVITWPTEPDGFVLQETPTLTAPQWSPVVTAPEQQGDLYRVAIPIDATTKFFRLMR